MAEKRAAKRIKTHDGASSSSSAAPGSQYQVFLSFRGEDTRKSFTDHLYTNLTGAGIRTFRDNEELPVGKEIRPDLLKAIEESTISIPIFSKGYASSKWCLMELIHMVECRKSNHGHTIFPIFYDVTPSDVRHQTGSFHEAFLQHTEKFEESIVQEWREALKRVADFKGLEKDKFEDGYEGQLVEKIVTDVCKKLKKSNVHLPGDLVGMDDHVEVMTKFLDIDSGNGVRIVGIIGMGGIGKTTIAKYMYNQLCDHFQHQCSFLEDVREKVKRNNGCSELQQKVISEALRHSGIDLDIRHAFRHKKVLIVLDDVEDKSQLEDIIGGRDCFGSGSRIIVTTRNKEVFEEWDGDLIYEPSGMDPDDSLLLFCKYAFKRTQPWEGYEEISREVVQTAAGLPLSLVVIGSMLFLKKRKQWEATLKKLKTIPADDVQKRLKISYDALKHNQKQMFLDIACHFITHYQTHAIYMWDACEFHPESCEGIDVLASLSLITIEKKLRNSVGDYVYDFRMHNQLRDLGRDIVYQESPSDPGQRSRLWSPEEAQEVLDNKSGTRKVQTLSVNYGWNHGWYIDCVYSNEDFKGLSGLRYLCLEGPRLKGDFKGLVPNLRWFRWRFEDPSALLQRMPITNFSCNKLVILDLSKSDIRDGWESWIQIKASTNLKVLNLSCCCYLTKLPECLWNMKLLVELDLSYTVITELPEQGIGKLTNLTKLILSRSRVKKLPDAIGNLEKLEVLNCSDCQELEGEVPSGIGRLSSLRILDLGFTKVDTLPEDVGSLCNLRKLVLGWNERVKKLPGVGIERLQKLEELNCCWCTSLEGQLPEGIWRLSSLRVLDLYGTKITGGLPTDISGLPNLETLYLGYCEKVQLPVEGLKLPLSITRLSIPLTEASVNGVRGLVNLWELIFVKNVGYCCEPVAEDEDMGVVVDHDNSNNGIPIIDMPSNLEWLTLVGLDDHVMGCRLLPAMKFDSSSRLKSLDILNCTFGRVPTGSLDLSNCQMLKRLYISRCHEMRDSANFGSLLGSTSESISISSCHSLEVLLLSDLSSPKRLKSLWIRSCPKLREIKGLELLPSLEELIIEDCPLLIQPDLSNCRMLKVLHIEWTREIYLIQLPVEGLKFPLNLTELSIPLTAASLNVIKRLVNLRKLTFDKNVGCCEPVAEEEEGVIVDHCNNYPLLPIIDMPSNLKGLTLRGWDDHVMSCRLLAAMKFDSSSRLDMLRIENCTFERVPTGSLDLSNFQMLKALEISDCQLMREIKGLGVLTSLETLDVSYCLQLMLLDLSNCQMLRKLIILFCPAMMVIKGLEVLTSLSVHKSYLLKKDELHPDSLKSKGLKMFGIEGSSS